MILKTATEKKVVVVTGGMGLLGASFCESIIENGDIAVAADLDSEKGLLRADTFVKLDITSKFSIQDAFAQVIKKHGRIDAVVNNAYPRNKNYGSDFFDISYDDFSENISMNLGGYFLTSQCAAEYFLHQGFGNIINIASIYGVIAPKFEIYNSTDMTMPVEYSVIKSGLIHLTKYMAKYFKDKKIRVNSISPGGILNNQNEIFLRQYRNVCLNKGMLDSSDLVGTLQFLLSDQSKYINGQNIIVDDGFCL
jgi:NAD(P)-dependent dehydrogenase (short-subunit alcohol dehydrogenase family)